MLTLNKILNLSEDELAKYFSNKPLQVRGASYYYDDDFGRAPEFEKKLFNALRDWAGSSNGQIANFLYKNKSILDKAKKKYPSVFQPPIKDDVYRGLKIDMNSLVKYITKSGGLKKFRKVNFEGEDYYVMAEHFPYKPHRAATSWTTDKNIAFSFKSNAILHTKIDKDFYFHPKITKKLFGMGEGEIILISKNRPVTVLIESNELTDIIGRIAKEEPASKFKSKRY